MNINRSKILYISYDGMLEPLGQSQVLAYLKRLATNRKIHLISFEKTTDWANIFERERIANDMIAAGIIWHPLRYHKSPTALATAWDVACGILLGLWLVVLYQIRIVHARSYVPSLMAIVLKRIARVKFIFDMRGFWADERVDGGLWTRNGKLYLTAKFFERQFLLTADHVVALTKSSAIEMGNFDYLQRRFPDLTVIPTCVDLTRFKYFQRDTLDDNFVLGYVGSAGTWYLFDEVAKCFALLLAMQPSSKFLIVNRNDHAFIRQRLILAGIPNSSFELVASNHGNVPQLISRMHAGIFFYQPSYSRLACAPTKLAEFLACGIPCLSNAGVGDMANLLETEKVGVAIKSFDNQSMILALTKLLNLAGDTESSTRCIDSAQRHFSLDEGVRLYDKIYQALG